MQTILLFDWGGILTRGTHMSAFLDERGVAKPSPEFSEAIFRDLGARPHECLLIEDKEKNVAAARKPGVRAIRCTGACQLRSALQKMHII